MEYDHFYVTGDSHLKQGAPCEDFALSGQQGDEFFYAAVSDGCGGAHANTDVGARAAVYAFKSTALFFHDKAFTPEQFTREFDAQFQQRWISDNRFDNIATLIGVFKTTKGFKLVVYGDGSFIIRYQGGLSLLCHTSWEGMAFYPFCRIDSERAFVSQLEGETPFRVNTRAYLGNSLIQEESKSYSFEDVRNGFWMDIAEEDFQSVSLFTDGVDKVQHFSADNVIYALSAPMYFRGGFVKNQAVAFLNSYRESFLDSAYLGDDLAIATLRRSS